MADDSSRVQIPLQLVGVNCLGAFLAAFGSWCLFDPEAPARVPFLFSPAIAWMCLAIGAGLMVYTVVAIMLRARRATRGM